MARELAPRFQLVATIRTILVIFGVCALLNGHNYMADWEYEPDWPKTPQFNDIWQVRAAFAVTWIGVAWNLINVLVVTVHPHLQRFADTLPFPVSIKIRSRTILAYGGEGGDEHSQTAMFVSKVLGIIVDLALASLLAAFSVLTACSDVTCEGCRLPCFKKKFYWCAVPRWQFNAWWTLVIFQYLVALFKILEMAALWYKIRRLNRQGQISLL